MRSAVFAFVLCLNCLFIRDSFADDNLMLSNIKLETASDLQLPLGDKIELLISSENAAGIAESLQQWRGIEASTVDNKTVAVRLSRRLQYTGAVEERHSNNSFVIDFEEASTQAFIDEFHQSQNGNWTLPDVTRFVNGYITDVTYIHGFNIASKAATQKSGDCTEFAALSTALARALDLPSRFIVGTVIMESEGKVSAFGHAWSEVWYEEQWQVVDAALHSANNGSKFYLPGSVLKNEGTGYGWALLSSMKNLPEKITEVRNL